MEELNQSGRTYLAESESLSSAAMGAWDELRNPKIFANKTLEVFAEIDKNRDGKVSLPELDSIAQSKAADPVLHEIAHVLKQNYDDFKLMHRLDIEQINRDDLFQLGWAADWNARELEYVNRSRSAWLIGGLGAIGAVGFGTLATTFAVQNAAPGASIYAAPAMAYTGAFSVASGVVAVLSYNENKQAYQTFKEAQDLRKDRIYKIDYFRKGRQ